MIYSSSLDRMNENSFNSRTNIDKQYMKMMEKVLKTGELCQNRTGIDTYAISGDMITHNMSEGFPLLTVKKVLFPVLATELEGFVKGITDKKWYQDRSCHIWDNWHNPATGDENDLGKFYAHQWRRFNDNVDKGDQLRNVLKMLIDPNQCDSRRLIVSAWNPLQLDCTSLPACHCLYQINKIGNKLDLCWYQRSVDLPLGLPFNLASYALLLRLICKVTGFIPGSVIGFLSNVHIYSNQVEPILTKLIPQAIENRNVIDSLPRLVIKDSIIRNGDKISIDDLFTFDAVKDLEIFNYEHDQFVKIPVAV